MNTKALKFHFIFARIKKRALNLFKRWLRNWAVFDLTLWPIAVALAYFMKDADNGFWLNLSTELLGVYISIRFIEVLINKNQRVHEDRREIVSNVNWYFEQAEKIPPYFDDYRIKDLETEIKYFALRWEERKKLLDVDEQQSIDEIRKSRDEIVAKAVQYIEWRRKLRDLDRELENLLRDRRTQLPTWWVELRDSFSEYQRTTVYTHEIYTAIKKAEDGLINIDITLDVKKKLTEYITTLRNLANKREEYEREVRTYERLAYNFKNNIYEESA